MFNTIVKSIGVSLIPLIKEKATYVNMAAISVSFTDIESGLKLMVYLAAILASFSLIYRNLRKKSVENKKNKDE